jgi:hypothetical protein
MSAAALIAAIFTSLQTFSTRRIMTYQDAEQRCQNQRDSRCDELTVSMRSAGAAEAAVDYGGIQLWINILGLLGVFGTVLYARAAWIASHRSAETAQRTLEHGRAYVVAELQVIEEFAPGKPFKGAIAVRNVGQTPAYNVSTNMAVTIIPDGGSGQIPGWEEVTRVHLVIGSGLDKRSSRHSVEPLTQAQFDSVRAGKSRVLVGGTVVYDDIFGKTWWTQFCHFYTGEQLAGTYHTEFNRAGGPV